MRSFPMMSILITPKEKNNIFSAANSNSAPCFWVSAIFLKPYKIAHLTIVGPRNLSDSLNPHLFTTFYNFVLNTSLMEPGKRHGR